MSHLYAEHALLAEGWTERVRIGLAADGTIARIAVGVEAEAGDLHLRGLALLPAPANLHSHAFQRAMAGMSERRQGRDSFWGWRELMYRFVAALTPEQIEAIAAQVYLEMLEAGYAAVAEFHYLHHRPDGGRYDDPAETSARVFAAAAQTGIGLCHLPVLYRYGGAGGQAPGQGQRRFVNDLDDYLRIVDRARQLAAAGAEDGRVGVAPHSLRATVPTQLQTLCATVDSGPVHIHIAEQTREVEDIQSWLGARPVAWLLEHLEVGPRWCLVHATHTTAEETSALAASGAVAGLCPITEANLGDGLFDGARYIAAGGRFGIGSDSNVRIALAEELRLLEYGQRLRERVRNVMSAADGSVGASLYREALAGGALALARHSGAIAVGQLADLVAIDLDRPAFYGLDRERWLDGWLFAADDGVVREVWSAGRHVVRDGRHVERERIRRRYRGALRELGEAC